MAEKIYKLNRKLIKNYHEIFLDVPLKELKKRDPKKIYYNFKIGKIRNVTGLDLKYDKPLYPEKIIKWNKKLSRFDVFKIIKNYFIHHYISKN